MSKFTFNPTRIDVTAPHLSNSFDQAINYAKFYTNKDKLVNVFNQTSDNIFNRFAQAEFFKNPDIPYDHKSGFYAPEFKRSDEKYTAWLNNKDVVANLMLMPTPHFNGKIDSDGNKVKIKNELIQIFDCEINVSKKNAIIEHNLLNTDGAILVNMGSTDYTVNITGNIIGFLNYNPRTNRENAQMITQDVDKIKRLTELCDLGISFEIYSDYLRTFGITNLVIKRFGFTQNKSKKNTQSFSISAISHNPKNTLLL